MTNTTMPIEWLTLIDAVLKTTVILGGAAAASVALRRASAALRHLIWTLALCGAIALPLLSLTLPKWQLPIIRVGAPATTTTATVEDAEVTSAPAAPPLRRSPAAAAEPLPVPATTSTAPTLSLRDRAAELVDAVTWPQVLAAIWLCGVAIVLARLVLGLIAVQWLSRRTHVISDASWLPLAHSLTAEMGVHSRLRFLRSSRASMPIAAGVFRPSIIMPADADSWSDARLRIVLLHELAHVKRRDCLTHLLAQAACAFHWFNPLAWLAARRARTERERACDDLVLAKGTRGSDYADQLLDMARAMRSGRLGGLLTGASLAMAHQSQLEGRLIAILDPKLPRAGVSRARAAVAVAMFCAAVAPLGALQPWTATADEIVSAAAEAVVVPESAVAQVSAVVAPEVTPRPPAPAKQPAPTPHPAEPAQPTPPESVPQPQPTIPEVVGPIAQSAIEAAVHSAQGVIEDAVEEAVEKVFQDPKPEPTKGRTGSGRAADPRLVAALAAALKDSDKEVRENAMHALVRLRDPAVFEPLVQALKDPSADVREQAIHGLSQLRDRRAIEPLRAALKDEHAGVRKGAVHALAQLRDRSAVPAFIDALKDSNAEVREQAAFGLGQLRDVSAVDALSLAVRDENPSVREQAVHALSQIRDRRAVSPLISALKDSNAEVRKQAAFALGQLRDPGAVDALVIAVKDAHHDVREQAVFALGQIRDPRAIDALTTALKDPNPGVRRQAAFALGQLIR